MTQFSRNSAINKFEIRMSFVQVQVAATLSQHTLNEKFSATPSSKFSHTVECWSHLQKSDFQKILCEKYFFQTCVFFLYERSWEKTCIGKMCWAWGIVREMYVFKDYYTQIVENLWSSYNCWACLFIFSHSFQAKLCDSLAYNIDVVFCLKKKERKKWGWL